MNTVMLFDPRPALAHESRSVDFAWSLLRSVSNALTAVVEQFQTAQTERQTVKTLSSLDDRALRDIGVERYLIGRVAHHVTHRQSNLDLGTDRGRQSYIHA